MKLYYHQFEPVCYYCGLDEETLVENDEIREFKTSYAVVYPICFLCLSDGKKQKTFKHGKTKKNITGFWTAYCDDVIVMTSALWIFNKIINSYLGIIAGGGSQEQQKYGEQHFTNYHC